MTTTILSNLQDALKSAAEQHDAHRVAKEEAKSKFDLHSAGEEEAAKVRDSIQAAIDAYLASTSLKTVGETPVEDGAPDAVASDKERLRGLQSEGRTRDTFEVLYIEGKPGPARDELRKKLGNLYTPKDVGTVLERGMKAGYIDRADKRYFLTESGIALLKRSKPYEGALDLDALRAEYNARKTGVFA